MTNFLSQPQKIALKHPNIVAYKSQFDVSKYNKAHVDTLPIPFPPSLSKAVNKRQAEYFAARFCAYHALTELDAESLLVGTGDKRQPLWPKTKQQQNIVGSITHSNDSAICIVAKQSEISHLGIDIEHHMTDKLANELKRSLINDAENKRIDSLDMTFAEGLTLIFSAKETIFKTLFYDVGEYFGFEAAEFLVLDEQQQIARFKLTTTLANQWIEGTTLDIHYQRYSHYLLTYHFKKADIGAC